MAIGSFILDTRSAVTLLSFITFLGIVWWAYSSRRRGAFDQAAMLPFADEGIDDPVQGEAGGEKQHG